jgi:hypothetical protein
LAAAPAATAPPTAPAAPAPLVASAPPAPAAPVTPVALAAVQPSVVAHAPAPARPAITLAEAQPLMSTLLHYLESGRGERILTLLEPEARLRPSAVALTKQYDDLVEGGRVKLSNVQLKAEPGDGRLFVTGYMRLQIGDQNVGTPGKPFVVRAEFASRNGAVALTGLGGGANN